MKGRGALLLFLLVLSGGAVAVLSYLRSADPPRELAPREREQQSPAAGAGALAEPAGQERMVAGGDTPGPGSIPAPEISSAAAADRYPSEIGAITGRVVDSGGDPVAGAYLVAIPGDEVTYETLDEHELPGVGDLEDYCTGSEGRFRLAVLDWSRYDVEVSASGFAVRRSEGCYAGQELEIVLERGCRLGGLVTREEDGSPVAGALVRVFADDTDSEVETRTDARGGYELEGLAPGGAFVQVIPLELATPPGRQVILEAGKRTALDLAVQAGWVLAGQVRDARTGAAIAGAEVSAWSFYQRTVRTDAAGFYRLPGVRARRGTLDARADGYGRREVAFAGADEPLDLELEPGLTVRGRLLDAQGQPIHQARVSVCANTDDGGLRRMEWKSAGTPPTGEFVIPGVRRDLELCLFARAVGHAGLRRPIPGPAAGVLEVDLRDLVLAHGARVEGRVLSSAERPLEGVLVELHGPEGEAIPDGLSSYLKVRRTSTDGRGVFRLADLGPGKYVLRLVRPGTSLNVPLELEPGQFLKDCVWRFEQGGRLSGIVRGPDGAPLAGASIALLPEEAGARSLHTRADERGEFTFEEAPSLRYTLRAAPGDDDEVEDERATRLAPAVVPGVVPDGGYVELELARADAWIEGVVFGAGAGGAPVPLALVSVDQGDGLLVDGVLTGADGRFRVRVPSSGTWTLRAWETAVLGEGNVTVLEWKLQRRILRPLEPVRLPAVAPGTQDAVLRLTR